jgi:hypothetical protein
MDEFQDGGWDHYLGAAPLKFMFPLTVHVIQQNASCFVWKVSIAKLGANSLRVIFRFSHKKKVMHIGLAKPLVAGSSPAAASFLFSHSYNYDIIVPILLKKRYRSCVR